VSALALLPKPTPPGQGPEDDLHMTLREHLIELRKRLKWSLLWLGIGFIACYNSADKLFSFLMKPVRAALPPGEQYLHFKSSVEPFFIYLKVALYAGIFIGSPLILYQVWAFVAPGLYRKEKKAILPFVAAATLFFVAGAAFCYYIILPPAFEFLIKAAGPDIKPVLMMEDQLGLVMMLLLAFAIIFELPLALTFLSMIGLVDHKFLGKYRRHAIVVNVIIAAFVTPTGDPFNLALMAVPMVLCYELGVLGSWIFGKKKAPAAPAA
jgi:sec-independent protein translocase protein TatC